MSLISDSLQKVEQCHMTSPSSRGPITHELAGSYWFIAPSQSPARPALQVTLSLIAYWFTAPSPASPAPAPHSARTTQRPRPVPAPPPVPAPSACAQPAPSTAGDQHKLTSYWFTAPSPARPASAQSSAH